MRQHQQYHRKQHLPMLNSNDYDLCTNSGDDDQVVLCFCVYSRISQCIRSFTQ